MNARFLLFTPILLAALLAGADAGATPFSFSYGGRLAGDGGKAVDGPVDLEVKFYRTNSGGTALGVSPAVFRNVPLDDGVFQIDLDGLQPGELDLVFSATADTYAEITDKTHGVTYPRQRFVAVPYALKVPVDGKSVAFDQNGRLTVGPAGSPSDNQFLTRDADGKWVWASPTATASAAASSLSGRPIGPAVPAAGQVLKFDGTNWVPGAADSLPSLTLGGDPTAALQAATKQYVDSLGGTVLKKDGLTALTGTLGLAGYDTAAESALIASLTASGTAAKGRAWYSASSNQLRYWNGSAAVTLRNSGVGTIATSDLANGAVDASKLGADAVTSAKILDGTIAAADLANAAVDNSKLAADAVTSAKILDGTIATADLANLAVTSANIANMTIIDGNISATAAIGRAKIASGTSSHVLINDGTGGLSSEAQLAISRGGTGVTSAPSNGNLLIGNAGAYSLGTLTSGSGISIAPGPGTITISAVPDPGKVNLTGGTMTGQLQGTSGSAASPGFSFNADSSTGLFKPATNTFAVATAGIERMRIDSAGYVGIGTTSPISLLHTTEAAAKTASYTGVLHTVADTSSTVSVNKIGMDIESTGTWNGTSAVNTGLVVNATGGTTNYAATFSGGNVGIGTTAPTSLLSVNGPVESLVGGFKFPDGSQQTTASAGVVGGCDSSGPWSAAGATPPTNCNNAGSCQASNATFSALTAVACPPGSTWRGIVTALPGYFGLGCGAAWGGTGAFYVKYATFGFCVK